MENGYGGYVRIPNNYSGALLDWRPLGVAVPVGGGPKPNSQADRPQNDYK